MSAQTQAMEGTGTALDVEGWIQALFDAWRQGRPQRLAALFAEEADYRAHPFQPAHAGRAAIAGYWRRSLREVWAQAPGHRPPYPGWGRWERER